MTDRDQKQLGKTRWNIADQLRGAMNADDFRDYMHSFLFLRYLSGKYEHPLGDRDARQPGAGDWETGAVGKRDRRLMAKLRRLGSSDDGFAGEAPLDHPVAFEVLQSVGEEVGRDRGQADAELPEAGRPDQQLADDE